MVLLVAADYGHFSYRARLRPVVATANLPAVYQRLRELPHSAIVELPIAVQGEQDFKGIDREARYAYLSTYHWHRLINGYTGYPPASAVVVKSIARLLPEPKALELLRRMTGLRYVVVHHTAMPADQRAAWEAPAGIRLLGEFGDAWLFEVERSRGPRPAACRDRRAGAGPDAVG